MNHHQIDKTVMYQATHLVLNQPANKALWSALPAFARGQASLEGSINILSALARTQGSPLTGITLDKDRLLRSLISRTLVVAGAAGAYAFETKNNTLAAKFDVTATSLGAIREPLLDDAAQLIHDEAAALVTAQPVKMAEFNLTPALLTDLQSAITACSAVLGTPRAAISGRTAITSAIAAEIDRADENLKQILDRLILQFETDQPLFFTAYQSARKVVPAGGGKGDGPDAPTEP
ncbi:MAG: hypothetical protein V4584_13730 [Verrucomicrobiota bacterium]